MPNIKFNYETSGVPDKEIMKYKERIAKIHKKLNENANDKNEFMGWLELPTNYDKEEFEKIKKAATRIKKTSDVFVVIGIGGSYLGARSVIEALTHTFFNGLDRKHRKAPQIIYAGNNINPNYIHDILDFVQDKDISINVISKSGTTTEPAISFRIFRELLETKYGLDEARKRIYVTTDSKKGALKKLADAEGYETFVIPDNVGGRYSVLTAVRTTSYCCCWNRHRKNNEWCSYCTGEI